MSKSRDRITYIVTGAIIAALYVDLTFLQSDEACCPSLPDFWEEMYP